MYIAHSFTSTMDVTLANTVQHVGWLDVASFLHFIPLIISEWPGVHMLQIQSFTRLSQEEKTTQSSSKFVAAILSLYMSHVVLEVNNWPWHYCCIYLITHSYCMCNYMQLLLTSDTLYTFLNV